MFGLVPESADEVPPIISAAFDLAATIDRLLEPGGLALITGPSGGGKSTVLRALAARLGERAIVAADPRTHARLASDRSIVDLFEAPLQGTLRTLARAGLADARVFARSAAGLSDGERSRLMLALAMDRAADPSSDRCEGTGHCLTILADEFASTLDRTTARNLCLTLRRWLAGAGALRVVVATAHDDVLEPLAPDLVVYVPLGFGLGCGADVLLPQESSPQRVAAATGHREERSRG